VAIFFFFLFSLVIGRLHLSLHSQISGDQGHTTATYLPGAASGDFFYFLYFLTFIGHQRTKVDLPFLYLLIRSGMWQQHQQTIWALLSRQQHKVEGKSDMWQQHQQTIWALLSRQHNTKSRENQTNGIGSHERQVACTKISVS
jgi:hypothetical protein